MSTNEARKAEAKTTILEEESSVEKPASKPQPHEQQRQRAAYFAVRQCDSLKGPAIFFAWEDCSFYIDQEENEDDVVYQAFDAIVDAAEWMLVPVPVVPVPVVPVSVSERADNSNTTTAVVLEEQASSRQEIMATGLGGGGSSAHTTTAAQSEQATTTGRTTPASASAPNVVVDAHKAENMRQHQAPGKISAGTTKRTKTTTRTTTLKKKNTPLVVLQQEQAAAAAADAETPCQLQLQLQNQARAAAGLPPLTREVQLHIQARAAARLARLSSLPKRAKPAAATATSSSTPFMPQEQASTVAKSPRELQLQNQARAAAGLPPLPSRAGLPNSRNPVYKRKRSVQHEAAAAASLLEQESTSTSTQQSAHPEPSTAKKHGTQQATATATKSRGDKWEERFDEWTRYKQSTPGVNNKPYSVIHWERRMRIAYEEVTKEGKKDNILTAPRIAKLTVEGFQFTTRKIATFEESVAKWLEFRRVHGKDPTRYSDFRLGVWMKHQRGKRRKLERGEGCNHGCIKGQIVRLTDLGFDWGIGYNVPERQRTWDKTFAELVA